jgi:ankyrin repeat protein
MRFLALVLLLFGCSHPPPAAVAPGERPGPDPAARSTAPSESASHPAFGPDDVFAALKARDGARLDEILDASPALAGARRPDGASAVLAALFLLNPDAETFIPPQTNRYLRALLEHHPPLDVFDAAAAGNAARVAALVDGDASLARAVHPSSGVTPLHLAAFAGRTDVVSLLVARGAPVNARTTTRFHNTPLVMAALTSQVEAATVLLDHGADVELAEEGGFRALHIAAEAGDLRMLGLLLDRHADPNARADDGTTALVIARKKGQPDAERLLSKRGAR